VNNVIELHNAQAIQLRKGFRNSYYSYVFSVYLFKEKKKKSIVWPNLQFTQTGKLFTNAIESHNSNPIQLVMKNQELYDSYQRVFWYSVQTYNINTASFLHSTTFFFFPVSHKSGHHSQPEFEPWFAMLREINPFR
jgi:hypothetical protein